jgi:uncharacterized membrane protein
MAAASSRVQSIDIIRGAVMVLMAIDHVRVYAGVPAGGPTFGLFFTRWVTHFCAPAFVFLAGTSAFLYGQRHTDLSRFLVARGVWLILLELTVIRVGWTFNLDFGHYMLAGVIWAIGWSMIVLAGLARLPASAAGIVGVLIIAGHNMLDGSFWALASSLDERPFAGLWKILYFSFFAGPVTLWHGGPPLMVLYSLVPWVGVMAAGYGFGVIVAKPPGERRRLCLALGLGAIAAFAILRGLNLYGDPRPWGVAPPDGSAAMRPLFDFLNTSKYPASLSFLLMTLGPTIALVALLDDARGAVVRWLTVFGRVPFFYYLLHIPLVHLLAIGVSLVTTGAVNPWLFENHPMGNPPPPPGYMWSLGTLYLVWAIAVVLLYPACRWFAGIKARRSDWWLGYL